MHSPFTLARKFLHYWITASNGRGHGVHSPFVFEFITKVLNAGGDNSLYQAVEARRQQLLRDDTIITVEDFGAGSRVIGSSQRQVKRIAKTSLKPRKYSQLLHRMVRHYQPGNILEIGTSLGITTSYMAAAAPQSKLVTMEGAAAIAAIARRNFDALGLHNIEQVIGNFDDTLSAVLASVSTIDFAFIDGNHRFAPTVGYFQQIIDRSHDNTIIILDDIYWSQEMEQAWRWVQQHEQVRLTIDLFAIGIVVLRQGVRHKQHFRVRY